MIVRAQGSDSVSSFAAEGTQPAGPIHTFAAQPLPRGEPEKSTVTSSPDCECANDCCADACCNCFCPDRGTCYASAEYLLWWIRDGKAPPLATTGPASLPPNQQGVLGVPGTVILQDGTLDYSAFSGGRFTLGWWFDPCQTCALEARFFFLGRRSARYFADGSTIPVVARPFFNENFNQEGAELVSSPGIALGRLDISSASQLWGAEANLRKNCCLSCWGRWDVFTGFRYIDLRENLTLSESILALAGSGQVSTIPPGSLVFAQDSFKTRNQFYGGQIGTEVEFRANRWFTNIRTAVALGLVHETIDIAGGQTILPPGGPVQQFNGGLLALPSNSGHFVRDRFAVVPELGVNVGYQFTENFRAYVGYTFLYWSRVVRPGDQIDRVIDVSQVPNAQGPFPPVAQVRPLVPFKETDFWAHGLNFGLEYRW